MKAGASQSPICPPGRWNRCATGCFARVHSRTTRQWGWSLSFESHLFALWPRSLGEWCDPFRMEGRMAVFVPRSVAQVDGAFALWTSLIDTELAGILCRQARGFAMWPRGVADSAKPRIFSANGPQGRGFAKPQSGHLLSLTSQKCSTRAGQQQRLVISPDRARKPPAWLRLTPPVRGTQELLRGAEARRCRSPATAARFG
jgi:hypothetical protein